MRIKEIQQGGGLVVELMPDDCHTLADACHDAARVRLEESRGADADGRASHLYAFLACLFEGLALAGATPGFLRIEDYEHYSVEGVRELWNAEGRAS